MIKRAFVLTVFKPILSHTVSVKKNKNTYNFIELVTNGIDYNINSPEIDTQHKAKIEELAYIKLNNSDICDNQLVLNEYNKNMKQQVDLDRINEHPRLLDFLREAMSQELDVLFFWLNTYSFDENLTTEEINNLIFGKLVLMGYYANCVSPRAPTGLNERTPFVEYVVPVLKYFSAAYKNLAFQW
jgi:hypothetical protein